MTKIIGFLAGSRAYQVPEGDRKKRILSARRSRSTCPVDEGLRNPGGHAITVTAPHHLSRMR